MKSELLVIYALVVIYALCYQLQTPVEPFLVEQLVGKDGDGASAYGALQSYFSMIQTVGSLCFGALLDRFGVRAGFAINFLACATQYGLLASCTSINTLWASKLPGLFMAGFLCAQTAVSRLTVEGKERVEALGRLTTAYTIGGVFGPYIGGLLGSSGDYFIGAKAACIGSLVAAAVVFTLPARVDECVEDDTAGNTVSTGGKRASKPSAVPWASRVGIVLRATWLLLFCKVATSVSNSMASSAQPLILKNQLDFSEADLGSFMSAKFAFGGFANAFLIGPIAVLFGGELDVVVRNCVLLMGIGYASQAVLYSPAVMAAATSALGLVPSSTPVAPFIAITMLLSVFQFTLSTSITARTTTVVPPEMKGTLLGISHSLFAVARVFGPATGVAVLGSHGISGVMGACATGFATVLGVMTLAGGVAGDGRGTAKMGSKVATPKGGWSPAAKMTKKKSPAAAKKASEAAKKSRIKSPAAKTTPAKKARSKSPAVTRSARKRVPARKK